MRKKNRKRTGKSPGSAGLQEISDHKQAKQVMKDYLETVIKKAKLHITAKTTKTEQMIAKAKEILNDPKFIKQTGIRSFIDEDARVGRKSKTSNFFGYKVEFIMTTDERIIMFTNSWTQIQENKINYTHE